LAQARYDDLHKDYSIIHTMDIGYIGLGKMGKGMVLRLVEKGWNVTAFNRTPGPAQELEKNGVTAASSLQDLVSKLRTPRLIWLMVSHQAVDAVLWDLLPLLEEGDTIIDGGNSPYKETMRRAKELAVKEINFLDAGVSGGPSGARNGACVMAGGEEALFKKYEKLFSDISAENAYLYCGKNGAGHFVKMVHNGIEYGMMQAIAEGFNVLKTSQFELDLEKIADLYNRKSVIESRLVGWLSSGFAEYGKDLADVSGSAAQSGEGLWTVEAAKELGVPVPVIEVALNFRLESQKNPSYAGKILQTMRNQFGGHAIK
jgi:6-phosphogluconate dehydrogenase